MTRKKTSLVSAAAGWIAILIGGVIVRFEALTVAGLLLLALGACLLVVAKLA